MSELMETQLMMLHGPKQPKTHIAHKVQVTKAFTVEPELTVKEDRTVNNHKI